MKPRWIFLLTFALTLILDQVVKAFTRSSFAEHQVHPLWPGVFELTLTYNKGIAFGQLQGFGVVLAPVAILIAGYAYHFSNKHPHERKIIHFAMALLASGAIGNLIDRVMLQKVTDMFWFRLIDFPVFNIADSCITIAATLLIVVWSIDSIKADKHEKQAKTALQTEASEPNQPTGTI